MASPEDPSRSSPSSPGKASVPRADELAPEDFYFDGSYLVFTAAYHLKRGSCCNSCCRHCPWRESQKDAESSATG